MSADCPQCGGRFTSDICPRCQVKLDAAGDASSRGEVGDTLDLRAGAGPVLKTIDTSIGTVPRVLLRENAPGEEPSPILRSSVDEGTSTRYRIDGEIARGGMGSILKGRDPDLGRDVAIKVLREDLRESGDLVRRFVEEAQISGQLQHPGVVPIYELGTFSDRRPYFSMKLVKGQTLADLLEGRTTPGDGLPRFLSIFEAMARTMAYAHSRGVIHRDLKPSNVMVGSFGEVQVMDWGLAKVLARGGIVDDAKAGEEKPPETPIATARSGSDVGLSQAGSILGTPSYMPPEQARGESDAIDERADVFALGSILGEILTGSPAFTGRTSNEILRKAAGGKTTEALARLDACDAEVDLIALARACLQAEPEDRPRDANVVADRVTAFLAGVQERVRAAERERAVAVARAAEERHRRRLQLGLAASLIGLMALGGSGYAWDRRQRAERVARTVRAVDEALADASRLWGEAQAAPRGEATRWSEALSAAKRAEGLLAQGEADAPIGTRVAGLTAQIGREWVAAADRAAQLEVDRTLLSELEAARGAFHEHEDRERSDAEHAAAFRKAGLDLDKAEPAESGRWIAARSVPVELAGFLAEWARNRHRAGRPEAEWRRLVAAALAADPDPFRVALRARIGNRDAGAAEELRRLARDERALDAQPAASLVLLGNQLFSAPKDRQLATRVLRHAAFRQPADFWARLYLGWFLALGPQDTGDGKGRREETARHFAAAVAIRPQSLTAHKALGQALHALGKTDEAIAEFREAVRLDGGRTSEATYAMADLLALIGRGEEGLAVYREAIRLKPDDIVLHERFSTALNKLGTHEEAFAEGREVVRLDPGSAVRRYHLGKALQAAGKPDEAAVELREAVRLDAGRPGEAIFALGRLFESVDRIDEAIAAYREAIRIEPNSARARSCLEAALRAKDLAWRFPAVFRGDDKPADNSERLAFASLARDRKKFVFASRFLAEALRSEPKLGDDPKATYRYTAACSAARAADGHGEDAGELDDEQRANLRQQAFDWLRADLALRTRQIESEEPDDRSVARQALRSWQQAADLTPLRDATALDRLAEAERAGWQSLWAEVGSLLERTSGSKP